MKNKETVIIAVRLPKWLPVEIEKVCHKNDHRQYLDGDGGIIMNKVVVEGLLLQREILAGNKLVIAGKLIVRTIKEEMVE